MKRLIGAVLLLTAAITCRAAEVGSLLCEYLADPLGIDATRPRLSWIVSSPLRGDRQTAYRVLVASSPELLARGEGDLWDSGKTASARSVQVEYGGKPLAGLAKCYWKVRVWDADDRPSRWSEPARWSMGPLCEEDWGGAEWIAARDEETWRNEGAEHKRRDVENREPNTWPWFVGTGRTIWDLYENASPRYDPSPLMRKEFSVGRKVVSADLYVCGLGYYEAYLNGRRVGDHVLDPAWTNFHKRAFYVTYDVTGMIRRGGNAIGMMLGRGQYSPICTDIWGLYRSKWVGQPKAIALLTIRYSDGTTERVVTDESWRTAGGPVVYDDTRHGELYDARLEQDGWNEAGFSAEGWRPAVPVPGAGPLRAQMMPPVRAFDPIEPVRTFDRGNGQTIYDAGRNIAGWARVRVRGPGPRAGRVLRAAVGPGTRARHPSVEAENPRRGPDYASFTTSRSISVSRATHIKVRGRRRSSAVSRIWVSSRPRDGRSGRHGRRVETVRFIPTWPRPDVSSARTMWSIVCKACRARVC
ncbi:MAG: alpha-L-rhamnosidase N-terminal domain-containing protein [Alistipes sp.]